jgi:PQQ-dependent dehydrogenase (s-GDH family)
LASSRPKPVPDNPRNHHNVGPEHFTMRVVAAALGNPWEITWGPDGYLWVTERSAFRVTRIDPLTDRTHVALTLEDAYTSVDQDGLLGLALHPDLLKGRAHDYVYVAYTHDVDPGDGVMRNLRVRRYTYDRSAQTLTAPVDVIDGLPAWDDHGGGRLLVGPDAKLYLTRGDHGSNWLANACNVIRSQELPTAEEVRAGDWSKYQGKILRLNLDGSIPDDNPVFNGVRSHIYTYGHRNPQGLVFASNGLLYAAEHGPSTDDELNIVTAGGNYGWPLVAGYKDDRSYAYANWSASSPEPCKTLKFSSLNIPASVPKKNESDFTGSSSRPWSPSSQCRPATSWRSPAPPRSRRRDSISTRRKPSQAGQLADRHGPADGGDLSREVEPRWPARRRCPVRILQGRDQVSRSGDQSGWSSHLCRARTITERRWVSEDRPPACS